MSRSIEMEGALEESSEFLVGHETSRPEGYSSRAKLAAIFLPLLLAGAAVASFLHDSAPSRSGHPASADLRGAVGLSRVWEENGKNFTIECGDTYRVKKVLHNNLGGAGPDEGEEGIRWLADAKVNGAFLEDIIIAFHADTDYIPNDASKNGMDESGSFAVINLKMGTFVRLKVFFYDIHGHDVRKYLPVIHMTVYDLSAQKVVDTPTEELIEDKASDAGRAYFKSYGLHDVIMAEKTTVQKEWLEHSSEGPDSAMYSGSAVVGTPAKHAEELTDDQKTQAVSVSYFNVDHMDVEFGTTAGTGEFTFFFAFLNTMQCETVEVKVPPYMAIGFGMAALVCIGGLWPAVFMGKGK